MAHMRSFLCVAALAAAGLGAARADDDADGWPMYGRDYDNTHYSPLKQITTANVGQLKLAYTLQLGSLRSNESTPIVIGDTMYVSARPVRSTCSRSTRRPARCKWRYEPDVPERHAAVRLLRRQQPRRLLRRRQDLRRPARRQARRRSTRRPARSCGTTKVVDYKQGSVITSPPLVVKNLVITGFGGGEYGVRGSLQAYDAEHRQAGLAHLDSRPAPASPATTPGRATAGSTAAPCAWLIGSYDPKTNTVLYGTSNPGAVEHRGARHRRRATTASSPTSTPRRTVAFDADTGKIKWYLQTHAARRLGLRRRQRAGADRPDDRRQQDAGDA